MNASLENAHQWTHTGKEVLIVRFVASDGLSYRGADRTGNDIAFHWPLTVGSEVTAPDWIADAKCGGGLHGWPWALSIGDGKEADWAATWLVFGAQSEDVVSLGGKCKARSGVIRFVGTWQQATNFVLAGQMALVHASARGASSATGWSGASSATGWRGASSATGESGASSATGESGASSATGERGASSATGERGASSATGLCSAAVATGLDSKVRGGPFGIIAASFWNAKKERAEMRCAQIGDGKDKNLKPNVWYRLNASGKFIIDKEAQAAEKRAA